MRPPESWAISGTPERISSIALNQICEIADLARDDPNVIKLWIGESDLPTPDFIKEAAVRALQDGHTRYTYALGVPELRQALSDYHKRHWGVDLGPDRFSVTTGGIQAVMQSMQAVLEPGDEMVVPVPTWPNLLETVRIVGGTVVPVAFSPRQGEGFRLEFDELFARVTPRTKVIAINSPANPTGWIMEKEEMVRLLDFARERGIWILSDEVYGHFTYRGSKAPSFLEICEPTDRLLVINTFSKNWCMTGWRMGWVIFPEGMSLVFENLSQYNTTSTSTFSQYGGIAALQDGDEVTRMLVERSRVGREIICNALAKVPGVQVFWPQGTFYFFFAVNGVTDTFALARDILEKTGVGVAPGSAFGPGGQIYLRICFAVDTHLIETAAARLASYLTEFSRRG